MLAILPLRKNSKRIKNKNILKLKKKPLYCYILNTLLKSKYIKKIIISTDYNFKFANKKIVKHLRPKNLRSNCNINLVIKDVLNNYDSKDFIQVHATNPLLKTKTLDNAIKFYKKNKDIDSLFGVSKFQKRLWTRNITPFNHKKNNSPTTQDLNILYEENSCFYIFSKKSFIKSSNRIGITPGIYKVSKIESIDIDDNEDFEIAKLLLR